MSRLKEQLMMMIDEKDPTQKLIGVLAQATDFEFADLKKTQQENVENTKKALKAMQLANEHEFSELRAHNTENYRNLEESVRGAITQLTKVVEAHNTKCPLGMDEEVDDLQELAKTITIKVEQLDWLFMMKKYPWVTAMILLGLSSLLGMGVDKLVELILK